MGKVLTVWEKYCILNKSVITEQAAVAQQVAHLIGSEEVTGSIPVGSLKPETGVISVSGIFCFLDIFYLIGNYDKFPIK